MEEFYLLPLFIYVQMQVNDYIFLKRCKVMMVLDHFKYENVVTLVSQYKNAAPT